MLKKVSIFFLLFIFWFSGNSQTVISGVVTSSEDMMPIPGATVIIENTTKGVATDIDGNFSITIETGDSILIVSFVGMQAKRIKIGNSVNFNIVLDPETTGIEEVVVTVPYSSQKKETFTGSLGILREDDLKKSSETSLDKMLQGNISGLVSTSTSGQPGGTSEIRIRGIGSINAGSEPLYVIDGIPVNSEKISENNSSGNMLATLNPGDIESISVLKDASATSLYGSRASNGVIMITTKKGKKGETNYQVRTKQSLSSVNKGNFDLLTTNEFIELRKEALKNAGYGDIEINSMLPSDSVSTDWFDEVYRTSYSSEYEISSSGGNENTTYFISGLYSDDNGVVINTSHKKFSGRINLVHKASDKFSYGVQTNITDIRQNTIPGGDDLSSPVTGAYILNPTIQVYKNGEFNFDNNVRNVVGINDLDENSSKTSRSFSTIFAEYEVIKNLKFKSTNNFDLLNIKEYKFINPLTPDGKSLNGAGFRYFTMKKTLTSSNTANYSFTLKEKHSFLAILGYEIQNSSKEKSSLGAADFAGANARSLSGASNPILVEESNSSWGIISYLSNFQYNLSSKYYLSGSFRRDGSSKFSDNNKWANFWSVGFSWRLSEENFLKEIKKINSLIIRGSYGTSGNSDIDEHAWETLYGTGYNYNGDPGYVPVQIGNPELTWEKNNNADIGIDYRIFKNISGSLELYSRRTWDLLLAVPITKTSGYSIQMQNVGEMVNRGIEFNIGSDNFKSKNFKWSTDLNITLNRNKITKLYNGEDIFDVSTSAQIRREGYAYNTFYLVQWAGVNPADGTPMWYDEKGNLTSNYQDAARKISGNADPKITSGIKNSLRYKNFDLSFFIYICYGNKIYNNVDRVLLSDGAFTEYNQSDKAMERWQAPGDITEIPKIIFNNSSNGNQSSTRYLEDGSFLRLKNINLSYNFGNEKLMKYKINNMKFFIQCSNILTLTNFSGVDPEQNIRGVAWFSYPNTKNFSAGINIEF